MQKYTKQSGVSSTVGKYFPVFRKVFSSICDRHFHNLEFHLVSYYSIKELFLAWVTCGKCSNTKFFLVRIFQHSDWIRRDTKYLSVFSRNAGKYGPEKNSVFGHFSRSEYKLFLNYGFTLHFLKNYSHKKVVYVKKETTNKYLGSHLSHTSNT